MRARDWLLVGGALTLAAVIVAACTYAAHCYAAAVEAYDRALES